MKFDKHQHTFGGMANVDFSFTLDSCYMRTMTDVCSVFDNWSWGGRGHRPERGLENRFHRWKGMKFTHIGGEGGGLGCCKCNWPQATTGDEWIPSFRAGFEYQTCSCNQWITGLIFLVVIIWLWICGVVVLVRQWQVTSSYDKNQHWARSSWLPYSTYLYVDFHLLSRRWRLHTGVVKCSSSYFRQEWIF